MNEKDKFECRAQEIHDANTNVTVAFGTHNGSGHRWMRIAVPYGAPTPDDPQATETKTSTVTFGPDGQVLNILPHVGGAIVDDDNSHKTDKKPDRIEEPHSTSRSGHAKK